VAVTESRSHRDNATVGLSTNRDRGGPCGPTPPTPPCVRVRTRRFDPVEHATKQPAELLGVCRAFSRARRRLRLGPFRCGLRGFTPSTSREGQLQLVVLPLAAHEITSPTCRSRSFGPSSAVPGSAYPLAASFDLAVPHEPCRRHGLLCPLLTSATRSGPLAAPSVPPSRTGHAADLPR